MSSILTKYAIILLFLLTWSCDKVTPEVETEQITIRSADSALVGETITFSVENAVSGVEYSWDFGDSASAVGISVEHSYSSPDNYIVTVSDQANTLSEVKKLIRVSLISSIDGRQSFINWLSDQNGTTQICSHRSLHTSDPENSLEAVKAAIDNEIPIVEIDIRQTKDGTLVLMHDATIDRTSNGSGLVSEMTLDELKSFYLIKSDGNITLETIPTLKEVFLASRGKIYFDLDIDKKVLFSKVFDMVDLCGMSEQVFYYSSESNVIDDIIQGRGIAMPILKSQQDIDFYKVRDIELVHLNSTTIESEFISQVKDLNWKTFANAYVNSSNSPAKDNYNELKNMIEAGIDLVQTDFPLELKAYLSDN